jgi:predicted SAM-dependent methyltransferase
VDAVEFVGTHVRTNANNLSMFESGSVGRIYSSHTLEHFSMSTSYSILDDEVIINNSNNENKKNNNNNNNNQNKNFNNNNINTNNNNENNINNNNHNNINNNNNIMQKQSDIMRTLLEWNRVLKRGGELFISVPDTEKLAYILTIGNLTTSQKSGLNSIMYGGQDSKYNIHYTGGFYGVFLELLIYANFCDVKRVESLDFFEDASKFIVQYYLKKQFWNSPTILDDFNLNSFNISQGAFNASTIITSYISLNIKATKCF